jgi:hypothetical protein
MKRGYTALEYRSIVRRLRRRAGAQPASDFIVGFPARPRRLRAPRSSSRATLAIRRLVLVRLQPAPGTPAADLPTRVRRGKNERLQRLQRSSMRSAARQRSMVGTRSACWSRVLDEDASELRRPHRQQPRGELSRAAALIHSMSRCASGALSHSCEVSWSECEQAGRSQARPVDNQRLARLCGALDENLRQIESALDVHHRAPRRQVHRARRAGAEARRRRSSTSTTAPRAT